MKKFEFNNGNETIRTWCQRYKDKWVTFPEFQREFIWDGRFKSELLLSILKGFPIGAIIFQENFDYGTEYKIVDGQQRLRTIFDFIYPDVQKNNKIILNEFQKNNIAICLKQICTMKNL